MSIQRIVLLAKFPYVSGGPALQAGLSKDSSLRPTVLTLSLHNSDYILYNIFKIVITMIISEEFGLIGSFVIH